MSTDNAAAAERPFGVVSILIAFVGLLTVGFGVLLVPESVLGGFWIAAIGLSLVFSGLFASAWAGERFGLSPTDRRWLSIGFVLVAVVLLVLFVVINVAGVESGGFEASP